MGSYPKYILQITLSILLIYFGFSQILLPEQWVDYVDFQFLQMINPVYVVLLNGAVEIFFAILIFSGVLLLFSASLMGLHILFIAVLIGMNPIGIRDFAIAGAFFALASLGSQSMRVSNNQLNNRRRSG